MSGPTGPTGITGPTGMQGLRGQRGPPYGPTGPSYATTANRLTIVTPSSSTIQLTVGSLGTYYNITSNATSDGNITVSFPLCNSTYPETNELFPAPEQAGTFWRIRNNYSTYLIVTFSNGIVSYDGSNNLSSIYMAPGQGTSITYDGSNAFICM
jgi:hypothetical protein